jgi:hypothetical protein
VSLSLDRELYDGLKELAKESERSAAGQLRYILRRVVHDPDLLRE